MTPELCASPKWSSPLRNKVGFRWEKSWLERYGSFLWGYPKIILKIIYCNGKLMVWGAHKCSYFRQPPFFVSKHDTVIVVPIPYWAAKVFSPQNPTVNCFDVLANVLGLTTKISLPASKPTKQKWVGWIRTVHFPLLPLCIWIIQRLDDPLNKMDHGFTIWDEVPFIMGLYQIGTNWMDDIPFVLWVHSSNLWAVVKS